MYSITSDDFGREIYGALCFVLNGDYDDITTVSDDLNCELEWDKCADLTRDVFKEVADKLLKKYFQ
jgi:hypothetical protein